jgi:hypothetical protein
MAARLPHICIRTTTQRCMSACGCLARTCLPLTRMKCGCTEPASVCNAPHTWAFVIAVCLWVACSCLDLKGFSSFSWSVLGMFTATVGYTDKSNESEHVHEHWWESDKIGCPSPCHEEECCNWSCAFAWLQRLGGKPSSPNQVLVSRTLKRAY